MQLILFDLEKESSYEHQILFFLLPRLLSYLVRGGAFVPITLMVGEADCTPTLTVILGDLEGLDAISPPSQATSRMLPLLGEIFLPFIFAPSKILAIMIHDSLFLPLRLTGPRLTR